MAEAMRRPGLKRQKTVYVTGSGPSEPITDKYKLGKSIGTPGNFGRAVRCINLETKEVCCCKIINKARFHHVGTLHKIWEDMRNEIAILKALGHENVVAFKDVFETRNELMIITELCTGKELFERISARGNYSERDAANVFAQLLEGIRYMHSKGIVHCDLKPDNFLFKEKGEASRIKIIDFGMSKRLPRTKKLNALCGTPYYTAPEILQRKYNHAADMWSLGVVLFVMIFGYPPFYVDPALYGRKENEQIYKKIKKGFKPVVKQGYGSHFPKAIPVSEGARDLIANLLQNDPKNRLTAEEALDHTWIRTRENNNNKLPTSVVKGIQAFQRNCAFKEIVCHTFRDKLLTSQVKAVEDALGSMDTDGDNVISQEEFLNAMKEHSQLSEEEMKNIFDLIDTDKSKTICFTELASATYAQHVQAQDERLYDQFTAFDLNGDGYISQEELKEALNTQMNRITNSGGTIHFSMEQALKAMQDVDANGDGVIDYNEFLAALFPEHNVSAEAPPVLLKGHTDDM